MKAKRLLSGLLAAGMLFGLTSCLVPCGAGQQFSVRKCLGASGNQLRGSR